MSAHAIACAPLAAPSGRCNHEKVVCGADYRPLNTGYKTEYPAEWAEHRICATTGHNALYARKHFKAGEVIMAFSYRSMGDYPTYLTVQVGEDKHIELSPAWLEHVNHSCEPNVMFNTTTFNFEALHDIAAGDELCFFYPSTEWAMDSPFQCKCGKPSCLGYIAGASQLTREQLATRRLTDFIANKLDERDAGASSSSPCDSSQ
ncbi:hypothetical protein HYH02_011548 [Chlamydomonas schloesseri]|uniref:Post-SET domain-containing protein n=1 Tax=Chlamydomonas schloesseri TaxID=2026947 RepID=A0A835T0K7_9CHLO|nr:hypothetical protein HYH02_011548 [Chlamydomonas schloesseri]|eukprot:KAG2436613.1 hypothetical protein HYH02_011548 [Chlamydomonas schloesseri]